MLSNTLARIQLGLTVAAVSILLLPGNALALPVNIGWTTDNSVGTLVNQTTLNVRLACSGNSTVCSGAGLMTAFTSNTPVSQLTGTAASDADEILDTLTFNSFTATGSNVNLTLPTGLQPGGVALISNIVLSALNSVTSVLTGYTADQSDGQSIAVSFTGMDWSVSANTNVGAIPALALASGPVISAVGTFVEVGTNAAPQFELRDLRGSFQLLTGTSISGGNVQITFRATFTLNLKGVAAAIPEPGTFALLSGGLLAFGAAAVRRRS